jgi:SagB-type dehydrogenase family enzyme
MISKKNFVKVYFTVLIITGFTFTCAQELKTIQLPAPQTEIGKPFMQAVKLRQSARTFIDKQLPVQELSNILWAAYGINRPESGKRTAPSAMNWQEYDIYVTMKEGAFVYDAKKNLLLPVAEGDLRAATGVQDFVKNASYNLVYVADFKKISRASEEDAKLFVYADCGFIAQNVYLYCASQGISARVRGLVDRQKLSEALKLRPEQKIVLCHSLGYEK